MNNFNKFYEKAKIEEEIQAKKKRSSWEEAKRGDKQPRRSQYLFHYYFTFEGVFQNIHESFDEIDSKSLNHLYSTKRTPASEISGGSGEIQNYENSEREGRFVDGGGHFSNLGSHVHIIRRFETKS